MRSFGLVGYPLTHSFSEKYFSKKFQKEQITDVEYLNFPISAIEDILSVFATPNLCGFNVTIPYKEAIIPFLDELDSSAKDVGAVNMVCIKRNSSGEIEKNIGYNTDVFGFEESFINSPTKTQSLQSTKSISALSSFVGNKALILGTGGSSKAVVYVLKKIGITFQYVSREQKENTITYNDLKPQTILEHRLIINTTPLGMYPETEDMPDIPYSFITSKHLLFDLIYNPEETEFLKRGRLQGAQTKNGLEMLEAQAERVGKSGQV